MVSPGLKLVGSRGLEGLIEAFLDEQAYRGNSRKTLGWYRKVWTAVMDSGITTPEQLTRANLVDWIAGCRARGLSSATLRSYDCALRVTLGWLYQHGYLPTNPLQGLSRPKDRAEQVQPFSRTEIECILHTAKGLPQASGRATALVLLLLDTGIRVGEASGLGLRDIHWNEGVLRVNGKTGERVVPFGSRARRALLAYIDHERKAPSPAVERVFLSAGTGMTPEHLNTLITRLVRQAGITRKKIGPHTFRHTFAVEFLRAGGDVFSLKRILGHSKLETTQRYVNLLVDDVKDAHRRFSPVDRLF